MILAAPAQDSLQRIAASGEGDSNKPSEPSQTKALRFLIFTATPKLTPCTTRLVSFPGQLAGFVTSRNTPQKHLARLFSNKPALCPLRNRLHSGRHHTRSTNTRRLSQQNGLVTAALSHHARLPRKSMTPAFAPNHCRSTKPPALVPGSYLPRTNRQKAAFWVSAMCKHSTQHPTFCAYHLRTIPHALTKIAFRNCFGMLEVCSGSVRECQFHLPWCSLKPARLTKGARR
jgi:hypothetical protein